MTRTAATFSAVGLACVALAAVDEQPLIANAIMLKPIGTRFSSYADSQWTDPAGGRFIWHEDGWQARADAANFKFADLDELVSVKAEQAFQRLRTTHSDTDSAPSSDYGSEIDAPWSSTEDEFEMPLIEQVQWATGTKDAASKVQHSDGDDQDIFDKFMTERTTKTPREQDREEEKKENQESLVNNVESVGAEVDVAQDFVEKVIAKAAAGAFVESVIAKAAAGAFVKNVIAGATAGALVEEENVIAEAAAAASFPWGGAQPGMLVKVGGLRTTLKQLNRQQCMLLERAQDKKGAYWTVYCATASINNKQGNKIFGLREKNMNFVEGKKSFAKGEKVLVTRASGEQADALNQVCTLKWQRGSSWRIHCAGVTGTVTAGGFITRLHGKNQNFTVSEQDMMPLHA